MEMIIAIFGGLKAGGAYLPLDFLIIRMSGLTYSCSPQSDGKNLYQHPQRAERVARLCPDTDDRAEGRKDAVE